MADPAQYFEAMSLALDASDIDFARRLISEAANDSFAKVVKPFALSGRDEWDAMLLTAMAHTFGSEPEEAPLWTQVPALPHATYLAPEKYLDDAWRAEIKAITPELFSTRNIWLAPKDLLVA